jgi:tetratricopeptide (TPR) repeat protein
MVEVLTRGGAREKARADSVVEAYEQANPTDRGVQLAAAEHWSSTGHLDRAIATYERLLARDGADQLVRFLVARGLVIQKREPRRAIELLQQVVAGPRPPDDQPTYFLGAPWWRLGQAYVQLGLPDSARTAFQQALRVNPQFAQAQRSLDSLRRR